MTPRPGTRLRPTGRGIVVAVACLMLWVLGDLTRMVPALQVAAGLLLMLVVGGIAIAVCSVGLRPRRRLVDDAVAVGAVARVQLELLGTPWITVAPLGRGVVREHLPEALGGQGDLPMDRRMPHVLQVTRRGAHPLGPYSLIIRDVFGLFHLRRTVADDLLITGLPVVAEMSPAAERATGIAREGAVAAAAPGVGEIGPIARPYASGDDIRHVHWRASARTGKLMTREDEPASARSAVIVLDTSQREHPSPEVEDRLVSHAATVLESLGRAGWEVRVLDASGDEITRSGRRRGLRGPSPLGSEADAVERRASLLALAEVAFDDDASRGIGHDHAAGHTALAIALGPDEGEPFSGLELDRFAGRATHRTALAIRPAPEEEGASARGAAGAGGSAGARWPAKDSATSQATDGPPSSGDSPALEGADSPALEGAEAPAPRPTRERLGAWTLVRGTTADDLTDLLTAADEESPA